MKKSVGILFIVGGLSLVGYYLLTLTKPKNRETQLAELDKKAKDLATSMIDVDNSDFTKAKAIQYEMLKIIGNKKWSELSVDNQTTLTNLSNRLKKMKYHLEGAELRYY